MKYKSEIIKNIVDNGGHHATGLHYESECIDYWIECIKGAYPKLIDYEGEWLNYYLENEGIGKFPYITVSNIISTKVENTVPIQFKSAILKGTTKYYDIDTGEFLETFEEGRNLELVSVKMPGLTTTGKNVLCGENFVFSNSKDRIYRKVYLKPNTDYYISAESGNFFSYRVVLCKNDGGVNKQPTELKQLTRKFNSENYSGEFFILFHAVGLYENYANNWAQVEEGTVATSYDPFKSNILTVNEDVTLRSNGSVYDELDLLTGKLTQRIDENREVLSQEIVKTVDLLIVDETGANVTKLKAMNGTTNIQTAGTPLKPTFSGEIPVEAITQNLSSFIEEE